MRYRSTADPSHRATFREAVLRGTPPRGGLYVPETPPALPPGFAEGLAGRSLSEVAFALARACIGPDDVSDDDLRAAVRHTLAFQLPVVAVEPGLSLLELFHGPTLAFKDVGARFLAAMLGLFAEAGREAVVLVATSGDTGGAVAAGLHETPGVSVVVLYPEGRVSPLQEKQFAALGGNVHALRVAGSFDDCQRLVKAMFADAALREAVALTSANSISVARLVPQTFYYGALARHTARRGGRAQTGGPAPAVVVPSGNVGNLTAGLMARRAGLPLGRFVAATNANALLPDVLGGLPYVPRASHRTLSTAMDVGDPSNLARLLDLYGSPAAIARDVEAVSVSDAETEAAMRGLFERTGYTADPHTAVGVAAWARVRRPGEGGAVLATAHPAKFPDEVRRVLGSVPETPERLARLADRATLSEDLAPDAGALRSWLVARFG